MRLRKLLTVGAAVVAVVPFGLIPSAQATTPHGPIAGIAVNGNTTAGTLPLTGIYASGTMTFAGFTQSCSSGSIGGAVNRGPRTVPATPDFTINALNLTCDSFFGIDALYSFQSGCFVNAYMDDDQVHTGLIDTGAVGGDPDPVDGRPATVASNCIVVTIDGGCRYTLSGSIGLRFDEAPRVVAGVTYQDLVLIGSGLTTSNQSFFCWGLIPNGTHVTLNDFTFNVRTTGPSAGTIDFHP